MKRASQGSSIDRYLVIVCATFVFVVGCPRVALAAWCNDQPISHPRFGDSQLNGITGSSGLDIWAVGAQRPTGGVWQNLALHADGFRGPWTISPTPQLSAGTSTDLAAVSAPSKTDAWAVGGWYSSSTSFGAFALHWNGSAWSQVTLPVGGPRGTIDTLNGVSENPSNPNDVWAVGFESNAVGDYPVALHWNGTSWTVDELQMGRAILYSVSTLPDGHAWAVGQNAWGSPVIVRFTGSRWISVSPFSGFTADTRGKFNGVATLGHEVWAVGSVTDKTTGAAWFIAQFDGTKWVQISPPLPAAFPFGGRLRTFGELTSISVVTPTDINVAGEFTPTSLTDPISDAALTLVEHWDGSSWTVDQTTSAGPAQNFTGIFSSSGAITTVGSYFRYNEPGTHILSTFLTCG